MSQKHGFTLIELSIVLVIIGLIVGGVLTGQSLIAAAERRQLYRKLVEVETAFNTFRTKYNCLPGDCRNATQFFGKHTGLCNGDSAAAGSPGTCNGDGNRYIYSGSSPAEQNLAINQLAIAGLIPYAPSAIEYSVLIHPLFEPYNYVISASVMASVYSNYYFHAEIQHSGLPGIGNCENLKLFDVKYDDGIPQRGKIVIVEEEPDEPDYCTHFSSNTYVNTGTIPFSGIHFFSYRLN